MAHNRRLSQFANVVGYDGGNIGIGTDNPLQKLHLSDTTSANIYLQTHNSGTGSTAGVYFRTSDSSTADGFFKTAIVLEDDGTTFARGKLHILQENTADASNATLDDSVLTIDQSGRLLVGHDSNTTPYVAGKVQVSATDSSAALSIARYQNTASNPYLALVKSRGGLGNATIVQDNDGLGYITFVGADGNDLTSEGAAIAAEVDGTPGQDDMPGALIFKTTSDGSNSASERLRITSDGKMGVGINDPARLLHLHESNSNEALITFTTPTTGATSSDGFRVGMNGSEEALVWNNESGIIKFGTANTERLRITSSGKIQVTGTRGGTLQPSDDDTLELYTKATSGNAFTGGGITFYNHHGGGHVMGGVIHVVKQNGTYENSQSDMLFGTRINGSSVAYRARLTSHGSWETLSSTVNIDIANSQSSGNNEAYIYARYGSTSLTAGTLSFRVYTNGNVQNTNNNYGSISDQNLKENIIDATSQWDDIKALQVRKYNFREATGHQTHTQLGLIAQEVETVSPGLVETTAVREGETCQDADGNQLESIKSINYSVLYMKAVKTLQEAQTRIETLETQNTDLLARVTALEGS